MSVNSTLKKLKPLCFLIVFFLVMCSSNNVKVVFLRILRNFPEHDNLWGEIALDFKNEFLLLSIHRLKINFLYEDLIYLDGCR